MSERSCPVSGSVGGGRCPVGGQAHSRNGSERVGPRGCSFSGFSPLGDLRAAFDIPPGVNVDEWLRNRERKSINDILYADAPGPDHVAATKNIDTLCVPEDDLLAAALGAPARQVMLRAEAIGPRTGWKDGYLSSEHGFCPPDHNEAAGALAKSPGRVWSDLCERMPGLTARGRVRESVMALPLVEGTEDVIPDQALWGGLVVLGMLCSIYRWEVNNDGYDMVKTTGPAANLPQVEMGDDLGPELAGIPKTISLPYWQISRRMGRAVPHLSFYDQASYNIRVRDPTSTYPYVGRFDNTDLRWPVFGERSEIAFLKGCADTAASFQHGPEAMAACQEHVMNKNNEGLLREMINLKEVLELMPNAFHSICTNPKSGDNYVSSMEWVRWGKFSTPLSPRAPAASGLQFPPYLVMDAFLGRKKYDSFLGKEGLHLRAWLPSNLRAFIAAIESHYRIPEYVMQSGDPRLMGVLDGIIEAYIGERGFMGTHRYKVFGMLEVAFKTGRTTTNGNSGGGDSTGRPWEEVHRQFSDAMKERLHPFRGDVPVEPHEMRGTFEECRYMARIASRQFVDSDPDRSIAMVTLDIENTGISFAPGDRLAVMPLNSWEECGKVACALGLEDFLDEPVPLDANWQRFSEHLASVTHHKTGDATRKPKLTVQDILRRGHLAPLTQDLVLKIHSLLHVSSNAVLQVLTTDEWPVRGTLGDLLQAAVMDTPSHIWDSAFSLDGNLSWLTDLIPVEVPRTYSISNCAEEMLPSFIDLTISRAEYQLCSTFSGDAKVRRSGVSSGFLNPPLDSPDEMMGMDEDVLVGISRPIAFQLPIDGAAPCAFFAGGSGIAPFRSFLQSRIGNTVGRNILYLGVQNREKFCYEEEIRQYVNEGQMEAHVAFSRDNRGLAYDGYRRDLVEKKMEPRYIDSLIVEQGGTVCDLAMSKKQGGLGGYLYVCGSVSVFDSVMNGLRKAISKNRTGTMESAEAIIDTAFAERRIMLDVFMTPKPLPCHQPTVPLSQLAKNTGHRKGDRIWIGVHGSAYDVTDFLPMHPGGTLIVKSNAGVDCSASFDNLGHTNNPEVKSLLTKYFVGHLTPKPEFHGIDELSSLYDLWGDYLRTTTETLVAQQFEMEDLTGGKEDYWYHQGASFKTFGMRIFYQYQSRMLQGGFSKLFGAKFQELVLKLSFTMANTAMQGGAESKMPDILGILTRAQTSSDAAKISKDVAMIGQYICEEDKARHQERGIIDYISKSVELDILLLEDLREEACQGMDAFDTVMNLEAGTDTQRVMAMCSLLTQLLERMARRLEVFYSKLSQISMYQPKMERNPGRTRWELVRRCMRDGSLFVLTNSAVMDAQPSHYTSTDQVEFDNILSQIQKTIKTQPPQTPRGSTQRPETKRVRAQDARGNAPTTMESFETNNAMQRMETFIDSNKRAMRRLSKLPATAPADLEQLMKAMGNQQQHDMVQGPPSPPSSRESSRSRSRQPKSRHRPTNSSASASELMAAMKLNRRPTNSSADMSRSSMPASDPSAMMRSMMGGMNSRSRSLKMVRDPRNNHGAISPPASSEDLNRFSGRSLPQTGGMMRPGGDRSRSSTGNSIRSFRQ